MTKGILTLWTVFCFVAAVAGQTCPYGWYGYTSGPHSKCYRFFNADKRSWDDARSICQVHGGDLVQIDSVRERNWVSNQVKAKGTASHHLDVMFWTGVNNKEIYNKWEWASGSPVANNILNWTPGRPQIQSGAFSCAGIVPRTAKFKDASCTQSLYYVCSRDRGIPLKCDSDHGWQTLNGACYKIHSPGTNWNSAVRQCNREGGAIVTVDTPDEENAMHTIAINNRRPFWIGLHSLKTGTNTFSWTWPNGTSSTGSTAYWHVPPRIDRAHLNITCAMISNAFKQQQDWVTSPCNSRRAYVCKKPEGVCQPGWVGHRQFCYQFDTQYIATFGQATRYCRGQGAELLRIDNANGQSFIQSFLNELKGSGIGGFWIGASDNNVDNGPFKWRNGRNITSYKYWAASGNRPTNHAHTQDCAYITTSNSGGKWLVSSNCNQNRAFVCRIPVNVVVKVPPSTPRPHFGCPPNWKLGQGLCVKVTAHAADWLTARSMCQATPGADLISISSQAIQNFVNNALHLNNQANYWIGLNDRKLDGVFVWNDGTIPISYKNWNTHEPNNYGRGGENCGILHAGKWNDFSCSRVVSGICAKRATTPFITPAPPTQPVDWSVKCGPGWVSNPLTNNCYMFVDDQLSWLDAQNLCKKSHGTLVAIETMEEQNFIAAQMSSMTSLGVWIGANDRNTESGWAWSNNAPFAFLNWAPGNPGQGATGASSDCVVMYTSNAFWDDVNCQNRNGFICEKNGNVPTTPTTPQTTPHLQHGMVLGCPPHFRPFRNSCYLFSRARLNWQDAVTNCGRNGGKLASISDRNENNFIAGNLPKPTHSYDGFWIGLNDIQVDMRFQWNDGSPVTYTNWLVSEPNNWMNNNEDCVMIRMNNGKWNDERCTTATSGYVCKRPKIPVSATQAPYQVGCPQYALGYGPYCYIYRGDKKNFNTAKRACSNYHNGTLATVNERILQAFLASQLVYRPGYVWIGLSDQGHPGRYTWQTGDTLQYTNWYTTHTGNERSTCVAMRTANPTGLWENKGCGQANGFMCQLRRTGWTLPPTTPTPYPNVNCPSGWTPNYDVCIKPFTSHPLSWSDALLHCKGMGGTLASFHNNRNDTVISTFANRMYWIGFNDQGVEGQFHWADGSASDYTNWNNGEPNNQNNEDCTVYAMSAKAWIDFPCASNNAYICQINRGVSPRPATIPTPLPPSPTCGGDGKWYLNNNYCYHLPPPNGDNSTLSWYDAVSFCQANGGNLASIHSKAETDYINSLVHSAFSGSGQFFIGLSDLNGVGYQWIDGTGLNYVNWNPSEPNDMFGERCVQILGFNGGWNDVNCNTPGRYVCKKALHPTSTVAPTPYPSGGCSNGFTRVPGGRNKCFYLGGRLANSRLNFTSAYKYCKKFGNHYDLASIEDMFEQEFLILMSKGMRTMIWIGLESLHHGKFMWQDNAQLSFTNWDRREPTSNHNTHVNAKCVAVRTYRGHEGKWTDENCDQKKPFLCQSIQDPNIQVLNNPNNCATGYSPYNNGCYKISQTAMSWSDALADCKGQQGGSLTSILDVYENAFVATLTRQKGGYWIGLSDTQIRNLYAWSDSWPVRYTNWGWKEPSYGPSTANGGCVLMNLNGKWNDTDCSRKLKYVCKISTVKPPAATQPPQGACPDPQTMLPANGYCYYLSVNHGRSWPESDYQCKKLGMQLASIHSKAEMDSVLNLAKQAKVSNQQYKPNIWIGLSKGLSGAYQWTDNSQLNFLYWSPGEPTILGVHGNQEECIEFDRTTGKWNDVDCFTNRGFICKTAIVTSTTAIPVAKGPGGQTYRPLPGNDSVPGYVPPTDGSANRPGQGNTNLPNIVDPTGYGPTGQVQKQVNVNDQNQVLGLTTGGIVGVVLACIIILALVGVGLIILKRRGTIKAPPLTQNDSLGFDNALYNKSGESISIQNEGATDA